MGSISAGIAALVAIYSFQGDLNRTVDDQAATLTGADLSIYTHHRIPPLDFLDFMDSLKPQRSEEENLGSMVLFPRTGNTRLVQIMALKGAYPYYGNLETEPAKAGRVFQKEGAALVEKALMLQFNVRVGDSVQVGKMLYRIAGSIDNPPGRSQAASSVVPVVYIPLETLDKTGLVQKGSQVMYINFYQFRRGTDVDALITPYDSELDSKDLHYETVAMRKDSLGRLFTDMGKFMSLIGFVALLLGCIGVASAIQIYIREKTPSIAIMRCLGVSTTKAFWIYLVQILAIGFIGASIGCILGVGVQQFLPRVFADLLPVKVTPRPSITAITQGLALGLIIALLFGLLPLLSIRRITPLYTLRSSYEQSPRTNDPWRWPVLIAIILFIGIFTYLQLGKIDATLSFTAGLIAAYGLLVLTARILMAALRVLMRASWSFPVRQGFANLYRPNNQTVVLVVAIGLSTALLCILFFIQSIIVHQLVLSGSKSQANMVLFDIQANQQKPLDSLTLSRGLPIVDTVPIVSLRISELPFNDSIEDWRRNRALNEELRITYRNKLTGTEQITEGKWIGEAPSTGAIPVSFEDGYARHLGLHIGDSLSFNVQGMELKAVIASFRKVEWNRLQTNFRVVFPAGVLEEAPQFHVLLTRTPDIKTSVSYQQAVVKNFPTVSIIDLSLILSVLDELIDKINYVIHFMAAFSIATGLIVLIASVRNSKYQRIQESVLLRTLGATRRQVFRINALEYFFLGLLSALTGLIISGGAAWLIAHYLFKLPFAVSYGPPFLLLVLVSFLTMTVGLLNSRGLLNRSTLEVLRTEV